MMQEAVIYPSNMVGHRFGRLVIMSKNDNWVAPNGMRQPLCGCICDCGSHIAVPYLALRNNSVNSCGCLRRNSEEFFAGNNLLDASDFAKIVGSNPFTGQDVEIVEHKNDADVLLQYASGNDMLYEQEVDEGVERKDAILQFEEATPPETEAVHKRVNIEQTVENIESDKDVIHMAKSAFDNGTLVRFKKVYENINQFSDQILDDVKPTYIDMLDEVGIDSIGVMAPAYISPTTITGSGNTGSNYVDESYQEQVHESDRQAGSNDDQYE